eukprot:3941690-Rhodomonas_salina.5
MSSTDIEGCYAMSGTGIRGCYAISGTDISRGAIDVRHVRLGATSLAGTDVAGICLRACYAMPGTDAAYGATSASIPQTTPTRPGASSEHLPMRGTDVPYRRTTGSMVLQHMRTDSEYGATSGGSDSFLSSSVSSDRGGGAIVLWPGRMVRMPGTDGRVFVLAVRRLVRTLVLTDRTELSGKDGTDSGY